MGAAEFVGCQSGFENTSGRILRALRTCVRILGGCRTILLLTTAPHQPVLDLWDSPRRQVILQCWYVKDQDVLDRWCSPVHQRFTWH
ncbi:unnamed protein product [Staurois parvus]|uniref:Uncharacterized protein n=1 Tax=Staurois parvus TaxID=386267 RepID=A0ABN9FVS2_9NEOB|nr:unnamed protein product [Staurois parvus]